MTKFAALALVLLLAGPALAEDETLLGSDLESGGYGALVVKYGRVLGKDAWFVGGQGGWIINHVLVIGGGGYGLANQIAAEEGNCCSYLGFGYGGFLMEFIIASNKLVHFTVQGLIGGGGLSYYCDWYTDDWDPHKGDAFFALEPSANVMLNLHKYIRLGIGGSYRYINGVNYGDLTDSDLSGATVQFIAKFGTF